MKIINFMGVRIGNGGIESFVANISKGLLTSKEDVEFIVIAQHREKNIYEDEIRANGGKIIYLSEGSCSIIDYYKKQIAFYKQNKDAVVWIHASFPSQYLYALAAKVAGVKKVILHMHSVPNPSLSKKAKIKQSLYYFFLKGVPDVLVACSNYAGKSNFGKRTFSVVHNGIECDRFTFNDRDRNEIRDKYGLKDCLVLGHVGRLSYAKNQSFSIRVMSEVKKKNDRTKLLIVGSGEDENKLKEQAEKLNVISDVIFVPATNEVEKYYAAFDILLFPSTYEGLGITPLEAQCAGLNVICSENVTDEIILTDSIRKIKLSDVDSWVDFILDTGIKYQSRELISNNGICKVKEAGFTYVNAYKEMVSISNS